MFLSLAGSISVYLGIKSTLRLILIHRFNIGPDFETGPTNKENYRRQKARLLGSSPKD
jgi:hypothetical protein